MSTERPEQPGESDPAGVTTPTGAPSGGDRVPRHHRGRRVALIVLVGLLAAGVAAAFAVRSVEPPEPGAFYTAPDPLPAGEPGTILRVEPFTPSIVTAQGWKVLYLSTDPEGDPIAVSATIVAPNEPAPPEGRPVVAWAHGTSGVAERCAPSLLADPLRNAAGAADMIANGWVLASTDYPGLGTQGPHPYLVGQSEARAVLDSVRAAGNLTEAGASSTYALWGHSQGGHATFWSGMIAADYAPELDLVAVTGAAPALELARLLEADENTLAGNVLLSFALVSWSEYYPDVEISDITTPASRPSVRAIGRGCIESEEQVLSLAPPAVFLRATFLTDDPVHTEPWASLIQDNVPRGPIDVPILVTQGTADEIVRPFTTQDAMVQRCNTGEDVDLRWYPGLSHVEVATASAPDVAVWLRDRFAGEPATSNCDTIVNDPPPPGAEPPAPATTASDATGTGTGTGTDEG